MPHFYLHLRDGERLLKDPDGHEFRSLDDARVEAVLSARELMCARMLAGRKPNHSRFEIADASDTLSWSFGLKRRSAGIESPRGVGYATVTLPTNLD
jgi:hypothetical protein